MLPVTIVAASDSHRPVMAKREVDPVASAGGTGVARQGVIEICIAEATVRFGSDVDRALLQAVVRMLRS
jgi:transposase